MFSLLTLYVFMSHYSFTAQMAIANAVGSNVFDILLGLGLPWFLRPIIVGGPTQVCNV